MLWLKTKLRMFYGPDDGAGAGGKGKGTEGGDGGDGDIVYVEKVDPINGKKVKIPKEAELLIGHFISKTRDEIEAKFKPLLESLEKEALEGSKSKEELEKIKLEAMSAEDRAQANAKKAIEDHKKLAQASEERAKKFEKLFSDTLIDNQILTSFGDVKLCNPDQVKILFREEGGAHYEELVDGDGKPTGRYGTRVNLTLEDKDGNPEQVSGSPMELFSRWIKLERNAHHVRVDMGTGGGSRQGAAQNSRGKPDFSKMNPKERLDAARALAQK